MATGAHDIAKVRVEEIAVMQEHAEAEDCHKCEDRIFQCVEAFRAIEYFKQQFTRSARPGQPDFDQEYFDLVTFYRRWLQVSQPAIDAAQTFENRRFLVANLELFKDCIEKAQTFIAAVETESMQDDLELSSKNAEAVQAFLPS